MATAIQSIAPDATEVALGGYSPVSYFTPGFPEVGKPEFSVQHEGRTYHLTSDTQAELFKMNPDRYLPSYGGWCAFGMSMEKEFPVDPENFKIVGGKLMLFLRNEETDARQLWNDGDEATNVANANAAWASGSAS